MFRYVLPAGENIPEHHFKQAPVRSTCYSDHTPRGSASEHLKHLLYINHGGAGGGVREKVLITTLSVLQITERRSVNPHSNPTHKQGHTARQEPERDCRIPGLHIYVGKGLSPGSPSCSASHIKEVCRYRRKRASVMLGRCAPHWPS